MNNNPKHFVSKIIAPWHLLRKKLGNRPDTEHEQILLRIIIAFSAHTYLIVYQPTDVASSTEWPLGIVFGGMLIFSIGLFVALLINPKVSIPRRVMGIIVDIGVSTYWLAITDDIGAPWYPLYLWIILGNGFRYGEKYLYTSGLFSVIGFTYVVATTHFWSDNLGLSIGLLIALVILPGYAAVLIQRLNNERRRAEEANRAKSEFLAKMSHEIRTPLNGIIGTSELLKSSQLGREEKEYINAIYTSGTTLLHLVEDILDISKIEAQKIELEQIDFDLHALINGTIEMLLPQAHSKQLILSSSISLDTPYRLTGDPMHLRQILINLLGNGIKFTHQGSVELCCRQLNGDPESALIRFEAVDTGIGISEDEKLRIFDKFTQADGSTTRRFGGTGLGTSIARQLVELMGGEIGIDSLPDIGSTFWFEINFKRQHDLVDEQEMIAIRHCRVMRITPSPDAESGIAHSLRGWGVNTLDVKQIEQAAELLSRAVDARSPFEVLIIERIPWNAETDHFITRLNRDPAYKKLTILYSDGGQSQQPGNRTRGSNIHWLEQPVDKVRLFNALHLSHFATDHDQSVIPLESHRLKRAQSSRALRILVAEDNPINHLVLGRMLERAGHQFQQVDNGEALLEALETETYDLVIADMQMPIVSGLDAFKLYHFAHPSDQSTPFIMLTANATIQAKESCNEAGIEWFLTKPVSAEKLLDCIDKATGNLADEPEIPLTQAAQATRSSDPVINSATFSELTALAPNRAFLDLLVEKLEQDGGLLIDNMLEAVNSHDLELFKSQAHALKGSAANLGLVQLQMQTQRVEMLTAEELESEGKKILQSIDRSFRLSKAALVDALDNPEVCGV